MKKALLSIVLILSLILSSCISVAPSGESSSASSGKTAESSVPAESSKEESAKEESSKAEESSEPAESSVPADSSVPAESSAPAESSKAEESSAAEESSKTEESSKEESQAAPSSDTDANGFALGTVAGGSYENAFLGIGVKPGDGWIFSTAGELAGLSGITADQMTAEGVKEQLAKNNPVFDLFAQSGDGLATMNIVFEDLGALYGTLLDESGYIDVALPKLGPGLEAQGFKNVSTEKGVREFAGSEHGVIYLTGQLTINEVDVDVYELISIVKKGNYVASVTIASFLDNITEELADLFYEVK